MERKQKDLILKDLGKKIVFITGPRQAGKTWLAKDIALSYKNAVYLNYDRREDRDIIKEEAWLDNTDLLILDELHKMPGWKNYLKGVFDTKPETLHILVTGSARLEMLRQGGDSLAGRFFRHRLFPFTPAELKEHNFSLDRFMERGGFPEPFLTGDAVTADRWRMQYLDGLIRTDILDFEKVHDLRAIQLLLECVRERTGSPVSYSSLAGDIGIAPNTVKKYIAIFESLYILFRVAPYSKNIARSLLKEPKLYFFDIGMVKGDAGRRFENLAALSLYKQACARTDYTGKNHALHYLRTKDGREVDFCLAEEGQPVTMLEAKLSKPEPGKALLAFHKKYGIPGMVLVKNLKRERKQGDITIRRAQDYLETLDI